MKNLNRKKVEMLIKQISTHQLDMYEITMVKTKNVKVNGRMYRKNEVVTQETITTENYINIIEALPLFVSLGGSEKINSGYTFAGFIPVELESVSPDGNVKVVRKFTFKQK